MRELVMMNNINNKKLNDGTTLTLADIVNSMYINEEKVKKSSDNSDIKIIRFDRSGDIRETSGF